MLFDDRLATVLRQRAASEQGVRTQYRQLLDLLGTRGAIASQEMAEAAVERLTELEDRIPATERSKILREPGQRLRNPALVEWLAGGDPQAAAAAVATARLGEAEWLDLIPRLPVNARGFLRHRRDLSPRVRDLLKRLGVQDLVLRDEVSPEVSTEAREVTETPAPVTAATPTPDATEPAEPATARERTDGVGALLQRIESFRERQALRRDQKRLPLDDTQEGEAHAEHLDLELDAAGTVAWAHGEFADLLPNLLAGEAGSASLLQFPATALRAMGLRQPLSGVPVQLVGLEGLEGDWRFDAAPFFREADGAFMGYRGRLRRPQPASAARPAPDPAGERMRQVLHELRTPVNAIQGFAEIIQQQIFGPAPNSYRALAAAIGVDAARLLAGFDEVDRLAKLETGAVDMEEGEADIRQVVADTLQRLGGVLRPRSAEMTLKASGGPFTAGLDGDEAQVLAWRLLATLAGGMAPGERLDLTLSGDGETIALECDLPAAMSDDDDPFAASVAPQARAVTAGMFGSGFTLRLVRAETMAAGGDLSLVDDRLRLSLPALTQSPARHSESG
ncbi:sensor histidine kinase [Paraurantiacibacter namhicola]|uniref:histidine kinase n=1 Tax=Paraurantiacibacter namhicola TaxID=645517 RepID=A0A1C7DA14_9SPHN|nr:histidine kinase dimerization/phospho-acceptor domain-containing protein [Paraurantiacibacter namhicola]ANU08304.1 Histidine protein kinase DivJ [Paraurantiacibacter namhicola]